MVKREVARTIMPTLGEELKRRREERQMTLSDISEATRIGIRFLKAIDTDNYSVLPGGLFTRSFIRAYAKEIGMSEEEAISLYNQQMGQPTTEFGPAANTAPPAGSSLRSGQMTSKKPPSIIYAPEPERHRSSSLSKTPTRTNWGTILIAVGILLIIGIVVTALVRQLNKAEEDKGNNAAAVQPAEPQTATSSGSGSSPSGTSSAPANAGTAQPPPVSSADSIVVKLEATGDAWIRYQVDEGEPAQMILKTGQAQEIPPAQTAVKLNYGNRQTLKLTINNREASFPADAPKFKSQVVISRDTLQSFFQPPVPPLQ